MTPQYTDDAINAWLDNTLSDEDAADFEIQMDDDPALRDRVEQRKRRRADEHNQEAAHYRAQFADWERERMQPRSGGLRPNWVKWAAVATVAGGLVWAGREVNESWAAAAAAAEQAVQVRQDSIKQAEVLEQLARDSALIAEAARLRQDSIARAKQPVAQMPDRFDKAAQVMAAVPKAEMESALDNIAVRLDKANNTAASDEPVWETAFCAFRYDEAHRILDALPPGRADAPLCKALIKIYHFGTRKECEKANRILSDMEQDSFFLMDIQHFVTREEFEMHQAMALAKSGRLTEAAEVLRKYPDAAKRFLR